MRFLTFFKIFFLAFVTSMLQSLTTFQHQLVSMQSRSQFSLTRAGELVMKEIIRNVGKT